MKFDLDPYRTPPAKLTSQPYPEIIIESLGIGVTLHEIEIYGWMPLEVDLSLSIVSGELRQLLKSADTSEAIEISLSAQSGELRQLLKTYAGPWDALTLSTDIQSGELKTILIQYVNWNEKHEELAMSLSIVSGTLA